MRFIFRKLRKSFFPLGQRSVGHVLPGKARACLAYALGQISLIGIALAPSVQADQILSGQVSDADTGARIAARLYIQSLDTKKFYHVDSVSLEGSAVHYDVTRFETSIEIHTTLSAHPFRTALPPGSYEVTALHGKEYLQQSKVVVIEDSPINLTIGLKRFTNASAYRYYSGDTHTHRPLKDLPNIMRAEDLNVALPLSYWSRKAEAVPGLIADATPPDNKAIKVDDARAIYAMNTEFEPNNIDGKRHQMGGVFILNHQKPLALNSLSLESIAKEAHAQGALIDLDKHSWPWSLMLVPVMGVDLYPLSNNHVWRTQFGFNKWTTQMIPNYMKLESDEQGFKEESWIDFGHEVYYALLNCGFRMRITAGTASGVHPVPLGFSRVYACLPGGFNCEDWFDALNAGQSFVTTGPMLYATFNGQLPGRTFEGEQQMRIEATIDSSNPLSRIEVVSNGDIVGRIDAPNIETSDGAYQNKVDWKTDVSSSAWYALRCYESLPNGRTRFAHTSPIHVDVPGKPVRPRVHEVQYLIDRMKQEIARNTSVIPDASVDEYRKALKVYEGIMEKAIAVDIAPLVP